ncbi:MAG: type II toxin-antitoxin system RelE/ParE family toxin [Caulobacteraceae bacterium]
MSAASVVLSPRAQRDLLEIADYLRAEAGARTAWRWVGKLRGAAFSLGREPLKGPADDGLGLGRRRLLVEPYLIVYSLAEDGAVQILRIIHGRRDLPAIFRAAAAD